MFLEAMDATVQRAQHSTVDGHKKAGPKPRYATAHKRSVCQAQQVGGLAGDSEVHGNLGRAFILADAGIKTQQDDGELAIKRSGIIDGGAATDGHCVEVRLQHGAGLVIEQGTLNNPVIEGGHILGEPQGQRAIAIGKAGLIPAELGQLGAADTGARGAWDRTGVDLATGDSERHGRHFTHGERTRKVHFDMVASAGGVGGAGAAILGERDCGAANSSRNLHRGRGRARFDVVNSAIGERGWQVGGPFFGERDRIVYAKVGTCRNGDGDPSGKVAPIE